MVASSVLLTPGSPPPHHHLCNQIDTRFRAAEDDPSTLTLYPDLLMRTKESTSPCKPAISSFNCRAAPPSSHARGSRASCRQSHEGTHHSHTAPTTQQTRPTKSQDQARARRTATRPIPTPHCDRSAKSAKSAYPITSDTGHASGGLTSRNQPRPTRLSSRGKLALRPCGPAPAIPSQPHYRQPWTSARPSPPDQRSNLPPLPATHARIGTGGARAGVGSTGGEVRPRPTGRAGWGPSFCSQEGGGWCPGRWVEQKRSPPRTLRGRPPLKHR